MADGWEGVCRGQVSADEEVGSIVSLSKDGLKCSLRLLDVSTFWQVIYELNSMKGMQNWVEEPKVVWELTLGVWLGDFLFVAPG